MPKGCKLLSGDQYGDVVCLGCVGHTEDGKHRLYRWRCVCGEEFDCTSSNIKRKSVCAHGKPPVKPKVEYVLPENSPCRTCDKDDTENCTKYATCVRWNSWFSDEWRSVQKTFGIERYGDYADKQ